MSTTATDILNDLLETLKDGQEGFRVATEDASAEKVKNLLADGSLQRFKYIKELQELAKSLGEPSPTDDSSFIGKVHRGWIAAKAKITGHDDHTILVECERGEDAAVADYGKALNHELPLQVRTILETQLAGVREIHDQVKALRDETAKK